MEVNEEKDDIRENKALYRLLSANDNNEAKNAELTELRRYLKSSLREIDEAPAEPDSRPRRAPTFLNAHPDLDNDEEFKSEVTDPCENDEPQ